MRRVQLYLCGRGDCAANISPATFPQISAFDRTQSLWTSDSSCTSQLSLCSAMLHQLWALIDTGVLVPCQLKANQLNRAQLVKLQNGLKVEIGHISAQC